VCLSGGLTHGSSYAQNARLPAKRESRCLSHGVSHRVPTLSLPQSPRPAPHILSSRHHGLAPPSVEALDHIQDRDGAQKATGLGEELDLGLARRRAGQRCRRPRAAPTSALATWCCVVTIFGQPKLALVAVSGESRMTPPSVTGETHAPTQHVHAVPGESRMTRSSTYTRNHRRVVGGYRSAVPLLAQPSHPCVNTAGVGVSLSHGALRSLPALWLPLLVGFACGVQFYPGAHPCFNWHHVRRELDRTRRLGSTGIVRAGGSNHSRRTHQG
jgi:hypothetical protein